MQIIQKLDRFNVYFDWTNKKRIKGTLFQIKTKSFHSSKIISYLQDGEKLQKMDNH